MRIGQLGPQGIPNLQGMQQPVPTPNAPRHGGTGPKAALLQAASAKRKQAEQFETQAAALRKEWAALIEQAIATG